MDHLFVYGTLAPGEENHHVLENVSGSWQPATLRGKLLDEGWGAEFGCPGIIPSDQDDEVQGYIFTSDQLSENWAMLDEFEGDNYKREMVVVTIQNGAQLEAHVYALNRTS